MGALENLARAVRSVFRAQKVQADGGKTRFGDWHSKLADAIVPSLEQVYASEIRKAEADRRQFEGAAKARAFVIARMINDTTANWLQEGRDTSIVFSAARVLLIVENEHSYAKHEITVYRAKSRGKRLRWALGGRACKACRALAGKIVKPGQKFKSATMDDVIGPPLHPHCKCTLVEV